MMISRIKSGRLHLDSGQVVLRSGDYQHFLQSREITDSARDYARAKRASADAAYDASCCQGYEKGLADGETELITRHIDFVRHAINYTAQLDEHICLFGQGGAGENCWRDGCGRAHAQNCCARDRTIWGFAGRQIARGRLRKKRWCAPS